MTTESNRIPYQSDVLYDYDTKVCPLCGGEITHPLLGEVTSEQLDEQFEKCQWVEVQDEEGYTLGYRPVCRNIHPYTLEDDLEKKVHYDLLELVNSRRDLSIDDKIKLITDLVTKVYEVSKEYISFTINQEKITNIIISKPIKSVSLELGMDDDNNICVKVV